MDILLYISLAVNAILIFVVYRLNRALRDALESIQTATDVGRAQGYTDVVVEILEALGGKTGGDSQKPNL